MGAARINHQVLKPNGTHGFLHASIQNWPNLEDKICAGWGVLYSIILSLMTKDAVNDNHQQL